VTVDLRISKRIFIQEMCSSIGLDIKCSTESIDWNRRTTPFKDRLEFHRTHEILRNEKYKLKELYESSALQDSTNRRDRILDADYKKADLQKVIQNQAGHLNKTEQRELLDLLQRYEIHLRRHSRYMENQVNRLKVRKDATPVYSKPFQMPRSQEETLKTEVKRLVKLGVLRKINRSEWSSPSFIIPKKNKKVRFVSDFRELNKRLIRKPFLPL
jgi:hypothetical protein